MAAQRILVAAHPAGIRRLEKVLAERELMKVQTLDEARQALERQQFCCMILGIQFDESRMLKLLEHVRSEERLHTPVVCVIGMKGRLSDAAIDAFDKAARALARGAGHDRFSGRRPWQRQSAAGYRSPHAGFQNPRGFGRRPRTCRLR
jgi:DNA-binding NtrC family response regulator